MDLSPSERTLGESHSPLTRMVVDTLRDRIMSGALAGGERLVEGRLSEELGVSPLGPNAPSYRRRIDWLLRSRRAFGIVDGDGRVAFKADLGAISPHTVQVQGVWVRPDLRGRGLATAALAAVFEHALTLAPSVSLYVNDYNAPARRLYARLGMREVATMATVLL